MKIISYQRFKSSFFNQVFRDCATKKFTGEASLLMTGASLHEDFCYRGDSYEQEKFDLSLGGLNSILEYFMLELVIAGWMAGYFHGKENPHLTELKKILDCYALDFLLSHLDDVALNDEQPSDREQMKQDLKLLGIIG